MVKHNVTRIALVGFQCAGKTELGRRLAVSVGYSWLDLNHEVCRITGMDLDAYINAFGMRAMRRLEHRILARCPERCVISTGAGSLDYGKTYTYLRSNTFMVWLRADVATTVDRIARRDGERNPLGTRPDLVARETRRRARRYGRADLEIRTDHRSIDECVHDLEQGLVDAGACGRRSVAGGSKIECVATIDILREPAPLHRKPYRLLGFMEPDGAG